MENLKFSILDMGIMCSQPEILTYNKFLKAEFYFSSEWSGRSKTAMFIVGSTAYPMLLDENDTCTVPIEVYTTTKYAFQVGVISNDDELITTNKTEVTFRPTCYIDGQTITDPTPSIYAQMSSRLSELESRVEQLSNIEISDEQLDSVISGYLDRNPITVTVDHDDLTGKDKENQHPMSSIEGLNDVVEQIESGVSILSGAKLDKKDFKVSKALDVAPIENDDLGLFYHIDGHFELNGLVREGEVVPEIIELSLTDSVSYTNQVVNNVIPFDASIVRGTKFSKNGYGVSLNTNPIELLGYSRVDIIMKGNKQVYPITVQVGTRIDGVNTGNVDTYTFNSDGNHSFNLNSKNDVVLTSGQKVDIIVTTNKSLTNRDTLTVASHSFMRVSDVGVNNPTVKITRNLIQTSKIVLKNSEPTVTLGSSQQEVIFTGLQYPNKGTAFGWSINDPGKINILRDVTFSASYVEQLMHTTNSTGKVEVRVFVNGQFVQNFFRKQVINLNTETLPIAFHINSIDLKAGDYIRIMQIHTSANGVTTRVTDTNHVGCILTLQEV